MEWGTDSSLVSDFKVEAYTPVLQTVTIMHGAGAALGPIPGGLFTNDFCRVRFLSLLPEKTDSSENRMKLVYH
jgi:hypothetical protein